MEDGLEVVLGSNPTNGSITPDPLGKLGSDRRVTEDGGGSMSPDMVWTGSGFGVSWEDNRNNGYYDPYFTLISAQGTTVIADLSLRGPNSRHKRHTSLAWTGSEFGLVWTDDREGPKQIYFTRIGVGDADGDGMPDGWEVVWGASCGLDPTVGDSLGNPSIN